MVGRASRRFGVLLLLAALLVSTGCGDEGTAVAEGLRFVVDGAFPQPPPGHVLTERAAVAAEGHALEDLWAIQFALQDDPPEFKPGEQLLLVQAVVSESCPPSVVGAQRADSTVTVRLESSEDECPSDGRWRVFGFAVQGEAPTSVVFGGMKLPVTPLLSAPENAPTSIPPSTPETVPTDGHSHAQIMPVEDDPSTWPPIDPKAYVEGSHTAEECRYMSFTSVDECYEDALRWREEQIREHEEGQGR